MARETFFMNVCKCPFNPFNALARITRNHRPPAADATYDLAAPASLRGARVGIAHVAPKQSSCNEKGHAKTYAFGQWNGAGTPDDSAAVGPFTFIVPQNIQIVGFVNLLNSISNHCSLTCLSTWI